MGEMQLLFWMLTDEAGTNEIILVKHTGCGMLTFKNKDAYDIVERNLG